MSNVIYVHRDRGSNLFPAITQLFKADKIHEDVLDQIVWLGGKRIILDSILIPNLTDSLDKIKINAKRLNKLLAVKDKICSFEDIESNAVSKEMTDLLNKLDLLFVPSNFTLHSLKKSGVTIPIEVIPPFIPPAMLEPDTHPNELSQNIKPLWNVKEKTNSIYVLLVRQQTEFADGADLLLETMTELQWERNNYSERLVLITRLDNNGRLQISRKVMRIKHIIVQGSLTDKERKQLYDICDLCVVPSRSCRTTLTAYEAIARGIPTLVTGRPVFEKTPSTPFADLEPYVIPITVAQEVSISANHPVHTGKVWEVSTTELKKEIISVLDNLDHYREQFSAYRKAIKTKYNMKTIGRKLLGKLKKFHFL